MPSEAKKRKPFGVMNQKKRRLQSLQPVLPHGLSDENVLATKIKLCRLGDVASALRPFGPLALRLLRFPLHPHAALRGERGCYGGEDGHDEVEQGLPLVLVHGSCWLVGSLLRWLALGSDDLLTAPVATPWGRKRPSSRPRRSWAPPWRSRPQADTSRSCRRGGSCR